MLVDLLGQRAHDASHQSAPPREGPALFLPKAQNADHSCLPCWYFPFLQDVKSEKRQSTVYENRRPGTECRSQWSRPANPAPELRGLGGTAVGGGPASARGKFPASRGKRLPRQRAPTCRPPTGTPSGPPAFPLRSSARVLPYQPPYQRAARCRAVRHLRRCPRTRAASNWRRCLKVSNTASRNNGSECENER